MPKFTENPNAQSAFYLKSGNSPLFKAMGSSPATMPGHGGAKGHTHDNDEEEMTQAEEVDVTKSSEELEKEYLESGGDERIHQLLNKTEDKDDDE